MKKKITVVIISIVMLVSLMSLSMAQASEIFTSPFQTVYKEVSPSVVSVNKVIQVQFSRGRVAQSSMSSLSGSGVVISVEGDTRYILTNQHVVDGGTTFSITADGTEFDATLVAADATTDIAVLKVTDPECDIPAATIGDSDSVEVGEWVMVIGTPLDESFASTLTVGIISGLNREVSSRVSTNTLIQTDAAINSGNSGGALFNTKGELIGIPSMKLSSSGISSMASIEGIGMAIPINTAMAVVPELIEYKQVLRPRIGVSIAASESDVDEPTADQLPAGIIVYAVEENSPAEEAGLKMYDVITEADGERVRTASELSDVIQSHKPGEIVTLKVYRVDGIEKTKEPEYDQGEFIDVDVTVEILDAPANQ